MPESFPQRLAQTVAMLQRCAECADAVEKLAAALVECLRQGNKVVCFGNGGSAAEALHFVAELTGRFQRKRQGLPAIALNADVAALTAIGNDYGFERVFERQVAALVRAGDVVIGLSTSGASPNVLFGLQRAKTVGAVTALLTGARCPQLPEGVDICVRVPEGETALVQEAHLVILHWLCACVDDAFAGAE
ncbi:Phosphoheptose isomerase 1 [bacterium HR17]|jgi:D-sedoheptulose 7-phosphate isomerase|uniref:Phosphoheptose isomerase 1 n=1 Tax=Candidatus Fervidibacter japonicus TaxID=2035412 RepID=A0A2H5XB11_9BACT|nr:Phosphoheptose isomerase 1 [bacterium HR17]